MKYSINGTGFIVAERDIYSLGGFIPKGTVGGKIASEAQLSQDGECWLAGGDISGRPDVVIKDNAYVGDFVRATGMHTDGITEFSGNTLIPGKIIVRNPLTDPVNNFFAKDSFIGVSTDVLCGPASTTTAFPFEQGGYLDTAPRGTAFSSSAMQTQSGNTCRSTDAVIRCGLNTYVYIPTRCVGRVLWAFTQGGTAVYSGESKVIPSGLTKIEHPVYKRFMLHIANIDGTAVTPASLSATGAKILGHINGSANVDIRPESASGSYVMDNSSFIMNTDNFGLATTQLRFLAGGLFNTNMYTPTDGQDYKPYGTFRNVEHLEYSKYLDGSHRTAAKRDKYISAYDCPLLRIDNTTYNDSLAAIGDLTLRNCIVPKAEFQNDVINGNTYEDIDFSYTNEDLGYTMTGYTRFISSHKRGAYRLSGGPSPTGFVSHKGNLADTARLFQAEIYSPLDGNIIEQGTYSAGIGQFYEEGKSGVVNTRIRTGKPVSTWGLVLPVMPSGYVLAAAHYLDEGFKFANSVANPTGINTTYPYVVFVITKTDAAESALATEFIALNRTLRIIDHTKAPEITGSAYVGAGVTVRGDVKLIGDPYVNRLLDVNMWERGTASQSVGKSWEDSKISTTLGNRFRLMDTFPVEPGGLITCNSGYWVECGFFDSNGMFISSPGWGRTSNYAPAGSAYAGIVIKKATSASELGGLIEDSDIPLANVKYLRAFEKRRYITNELDRNSSEDILIGPDYWEQGSLSLAAGTPYEASKIASLGHIRLKRPLNTGGSSITRIPPGYLLSRYKFDALTKYVPGAETDGDRALYGGILRKDPSGNIIPAEVAAARIVIEFTPSPRIVVPYGSSTLFISGPKIRMYDNAVLSRNLNQEGEIVLRGDAVGGYDFNPGSCMCSNGHSDAIIKLP